MKVTWSVKNMTGASGQIDNRLDRGSTLIEGAIGTGLVVLTSVLGLFFVVHLWQICVYKQKVAVAAAEAAQLAADDASPYSLYDSFVPVNTLANIDSVAQSRATTTLNLLGIPSAAATVTTSMNGRMVNVTVSCPQLSVLGGAFMLPDKASVQDTASAPIRIIMPPALLTMTSSTGTSVTLPAYGTTIKQSDFTRHFSQFSLSVPAGNTIQSQTVGTVIDQNWLDLSPVYPN